MSYRTDRVEILDTFQYNDSANDYFEREPYSVLVRSKQEGGGKFPQISNVLFFLPPSHTPLTHPSPSPDLEFFMIGIHTQPSNVLAELNALVEVYEEAVNHFRTKNGIMLGDFNADCSYLSQKRYNTLLLATDSRFTWLLDTSIDSTTGNSDCAYDRCVCVCVDEEGQEREEGS